MAGSSSSSTHSNSAHSKSRSNGKYDLLPSNTNFDSDNEKSINPISIRKRLSYKSLMIILISFSLIGSMGLYVRKNGHDLTSLKLGDKWSKLKAAGWPGHSAQELLDDIKKQAEEDLLLPSITYEEEEEKKVEENNKLVIQKKVLFNESKNEEVQEKLDDGRIGGYVWHAELQNWSGNINKGDQRLIIVGDVHGTHESLVTLLARLSFSQPSDILLHVGDIVSKSPLVDSLEAARLMRTLGAQGVRGNHDVGVIKWRRWMLAYGNTELNQEELESRAFYSTSSKDTKVKSPHKNSNIDRVGLAADGALLGNGWEWLDTDVTDLESKGIVVPDLEGWEWGSDWFELARHLPKIDYDYLENLPLTLHLKDFNTYIVHAGMLPGDFTNFTAPPPEDEDEGATKALSPLPALLTSQSTKIFQPSKSDLELLSSTFERSLLLVKENLDPFTLTDVRALTGNGTDDDPFIVTRKKKGTFWSYIWNNAMEVCGDANGCTPVNIIYGHSASRGLELKPNTFGLDSGCVYGKKLSALIITTSDSLSSPLDIPQIQSLESFKSLYAVPKLEETISTSPSKVPSPSKISQVFVPIESEPRIDPETGKIILEASWQSGGQGQGGGRKFLAEDVEIEKEPTAVYESFWKPDGESSITESMIEDGVAIAEKRQLDVDDESALMKEEEIKEEKKKNMKKIKEDKKKKVKVLNSDAFDDVPVEINGRKAWVVSLACPDVEGN